MANSYAFAFPKNRPNSFKLLTSSTVGYLSDSIFYRLDLSTGKAQALHHPEGRTYQAFAALHKRGITALADYGKCSNLYFYFSDSSLNFQIRNICPLQILSMELSLDGKYLAIACGAPTFKVLIVDVEEKHIIIGGQASIDIKSNSDSLLKMEFNPANRKQLCLLWTEKVQIFELKDCMQMTEKGVSKTLLILPRHFATSKRFESAIWDELGNLYLAAQNRLWVWSADSGKELASYDIEIESSFDETVRALLLTPKHLIAFYSNGRSQWLIKFHPQLLDEDSTQKPFQLDKFHDNDRRVVHALYDHYFTKLLLAYDDGFMGVLDIPAEDNKGQQDQDNGEGRKKAKQTKKIEVEGNIVGPYHRKAIILVREIAGTSLIVTVSLGGRVILWSGRQRKQMGYFDAEGDISCAEINNKNNVLAVGTSDGLLQFYSISSFDSPFLFKEIRLTKGHAIAQISFSSSGEQLAVISKEEQRVYYILTNLSMSFEVLGYVNLPYRPLYICWNKTQKTSIKPKHQLLLVNLGFGILSINGPAAVPAKRRGDELNVQAEIYALRTDLQQNFVCALPTGEIITTGEDKFIKKYRQPDQLLSKIDFKSKQPIPPPLQEIDAHDLKISCWEISGKWLVSGGAEGTVQLRQTSNLGSAKSYKVFGWKDENFCSVSYSQKGGIFAGSWDGCFQVWKVDNSDSLGDELKLQQVTFKRLGKDRKTKYFEVMIEQQYLERMKEVINGKKKIQIQKLSKIKNQLAILLAQNEKHDELQRLSRDQFAIDLESRELVAKKGQDKCKAIREESRLKILRNEVAAKKLKQLTWDRMQVHLKGINGLKNNFIIFNYHLRKISKEEKRRLQIIFDLRRAQKKQVKKRPELSSQFYNNKSVVNGGVVQPLILTAAEKKQEKKEEKGKKKKEEEVAGPVELVEQVFNQDQWSLLYNSFELFSDNAKRNQIVMMKHLITRIKETFNKEFEKIMKLRQNQSQLINDKNKRIEEICEELKKTSQVIIPRKNILESNDNVLQVSPNEILFKRYLSKQERQKAEKERLKQQERLRKLAEDDSSLRALQKMMGGTLQQKKTSVLQVTVQREKWMDKPLQEMSQEQKSKLKQFQQKRQKAEEEKERIVKKLEAELRKLKQQIDDIMQKYDEKLFALIKRRLQYDYRIEQQELYCTRLFLTISNVKQQQIKRTQLQKKIFSSTQKMDKLARQKEALLNEETEIQRTKQAKQAALEAKKLGDIQSKIKTIEKSIFEEYSSNFKKRRQMEEKLVDSDPSYRNLLVKLDPMKEIQSKNLAVDKAKDFNFFIAQIKVLQQTYDIPEASLLQILEARFNIRKQQAQLDKTVHVLKDTLSLLEQQSNEAHLRLAQEQDELQAIIHYLAKIQSDLEIQCRIKQGQVELNNEKPVPELNDALLISKGEIDEKNSKIRVNADEKIKVMELIKTCKISVTEETLNLEKKEEMIEKFNSRIKQIQMLKVKKEMQVALTKKDTKINQNEIKSLKQQIQKVRKQGEKRISLFEKKIDKVAKQIETIRKENKQLQTQKWSLQETVKQREKIKQMMVGQNGEGDQEAQEKFQQIAINRKLFDRAKQQTEQIELLREQLSKLKAKTFANFSNAQR